MTPKQQSTAPPDGAKDEVLFVFGAARSGTTFLNGFLFRWFGYGTGPEGQFVPAFAKRLERYQPLSSEDNLDRLIHDISRCEMIEIIRSKWPPELRFDITPDWIKRHVSEASYAGVVRAVFAAVAEGQGALRLGNKFPGYWQHLDLLHSLFPDSGKYLGIVRDGRDVALSTMRTKWGERNAYACAKNWTRCVDTMTRFSERLPSGRSLIIRYEDLLADPASTVQKLDDFLVTQLTPDQLDGAISEAKISASNHALAKWKSSMSIQDRARFEAVAFDTLRRFDYETLDAAPKISFHDRSFCSAEEFLFKAYRTLIPS